jgi:hypothetical protein
MNSLCDGHVANGLVSNNVNGFSDVFWMCFASNCAYVMSLWLCYRSTFSGEADQGYHDATSMLTAMQPQLMGNIHKGNKLGITRRQCFEE